MKNQLNLLILGGLTVAAVGVASLAILDGKRDDAPEDAGVLFPTLKEHINDVARMKIRTADGERTLAIQDGTWRIEDCAGYPAEFEKVKEAIFKVAELEIEATKTKLPARHAALGVEGLKDAPDEAPPEPDATEPSERSKSTHVTLWDSQGTELAAVILGESEYLRGSSLVYARRAGEDQVYQCKGRADLRPEVRNWADTTLLEIPGSRVQAVRIRQGEQEYVQIDRKPGEGDQFEVSNMPEGRTEKYAGIANGVATNLSSLTLEDVRQSSEIPFEGDSLVTTEYTLEDGLSILLRTVEEDGTTWGHITAHYEEPMGPLVPPPVEPPPADETAEGTEGEDPEAAAEAAAADAATKAAEARVALAKEAEEWNARLGEWAFALPSYKATNLRKPMAEFLAEPEESVPETADDSGFVPPDEPPLESGDGSAGTEGGDAGGDGFQNGSGVETTGDDGSGGE